MYMGHTSRIWLWWCFKRRAVNLNEQVLQSKAPDAIIYIVFAQGMGRDSAVGIATRYRLDGPGSESQWGRDFPHMSRPALGSTQPPIRWVLGLSRGSISWGIALITHPPSSAEVKEGVELYLCSTSGPSWPVTG
jgi:hypothetical protein